MYTQAALLGLIVAIIEFFGGMLSNGNILISDCGHVLSDVVMNGSFALIAAYVQKKDPDRGIFLRRLGATLQSGILLVFGIWVVVEANTSHEHVNANLLTGASIVALLFNVCQYRIILKASKNITRFAAIVHAILDLFQSAFAVATGIWIYFFEDSDLDTKASTCFGVMMIAFSAYLFGKIFLSRGESSHHHH